MIKYKNNINVGTGSVGYDADATSAAPQDSVNEGRIVKSEGRTVKWNQVVDNNYSTNNASKTVNSDGSITVTANTEGTVGTILNSNARNYLANNSEHKYYISAHVKSTGGGKVIIGQVAYDGQGRNGISLSVACTNDYTKATFITTNSASNMYTFGITCDKTSIPTNFTFKYLICVDLTSIFGSGNEPATVEAFESWLAENMVEQEYYAYDAGSLVPVTVKGVKRDVGGTTVTNPMPVTTLKDDNDVVMFPDGLKSAGSVKDEIDWENGVAVKRVGVVDLGDLTWGKPEIGTTGYYRFMSGLSNAKVASDASTKANMVCSLYTTLAVGETYSRIVGIAIGTSGGLYVYDSARENLDASDFKTAMQGVLLYYELATPITYHFATHADLKKRIVKIGESVEVDGIEGETVVWNQLVENGDFSNGTTGWSGYHVSIAATNNILTATITTTSIDYLGKNNFSFKIGHRYLFVCDINPSSNTYVRFQHVGFGTDFPNAGTQIIGNTWNHYSCIGTITATPNNYLYLYLNITSSLAENATVAVKNLMVHDLTQMFGSGNEPSTVAEFESWLSAHGGIKDYYPYCAGELKDKEEGNVRGVGFNLWDEEWESGYYNSDGSKGPSLNTCFRCKNPTPVLPSTTYYLKTSASGTVAIRLLDGNGNVISTRYGNNNTFTTSENCRNIIFNNLIEAHQPTYTNDICINLSDASRNGTYVPYKSITRSVDLTTLKGKVNGAGEDVVMFSDGMKQAGSVKDEIYVEGGVVKAVKRVGTVDLGELTWRIDSSSGSVPFFSALKGSDVLAGFQARCKCAKYKSVAVSEVMSGTTGIAIGDNYVNIYDSTYTSASDFTTAMQGVMLNYELASPVTYVVNMQGMEMADVKKVMVGAQKVWEIQ